MVRFYIQQVKEYFLADFFGITPDIFGFLVNAIVSLIYNIPLMDQTRQHFNQQILGHVFVLYGLTHSLVIFAAVFLAVWVARKKMFLPLLAWGIHIVFDIPFHSAEFSPTPFLFPVSSFKFPGLAWSNSYLVIINYSVLGILYLAFFILKNKKRRLAKYLAEKEK